MNEKLQFVARRLAGEAMAGGLASPVKLVTTSSLSGMRTPGAERSQPASLSLRSSTPLSDGELHLEREA